ncbi:MAG TPA: hypothetical protein DCQ31_12720 [Bacteroidales bacterium]|nr:hypothetical protein [Bacteroidales bacterium]
MNKFVTMLFLSGIILFSCNTPNSDATNNKTENEITTSAEKTNYELLQGKWQSVEDTSVILVFDKNNRQEIVAGAEEPGEAFVLSDKCANETDKNAEIPAEKDRYISCAQSDMCWYIIEVNAENLSLSYMGRGNTLNYKRVK